MSLKVDFHVKLHVKASRNAAIYCGAEILSLDWECKSDRLLLIGTANGGIKALNVDSESVLDLKCSLVEPVIVSAAASTRHGSSYIDSLGFASLTVWKMKTWKAMVRDSLSQKLILECSHQWGLDIIYYALMNFKLQ